MSANVSNYKEQGGAAWRIGGKVHVLDDGTLEFGTGSGGTGDVKFTFDGVVLKITGLPTSDPQISGGLWSNAGVLTLSDGI
jgi:hypothetical protein